MIVSVAAFVVFFSVYKNSDAGCWVPYQCDDIRCCVIQFWPLMMSA